MRIKIPKQIKICSRTYTIKIDSKTCMGAGSTGLTRHQFDDILLDDIVPVGQMNQILLHEILHVIETVFTIKIDDADTDRLAEGFLIFLQDNLGIEFDWSAIKEE